MQYCYTHTPIHTHPYRHTYYMILHTCRSSLYLTEGSMFTLLQMSRSKECVGSTTCWYLPTRRVRLCSCKLVVNNELVRYTVVQIDGFMWLCEHILYIAVSLMFVPHANLLVLLNTGWTTCLVSVFYLVGHVRTSWCTCGVHCGVLCLAKRFTL